MDTGFLVIERKGNNTRYMVYYNFNNMCKEEGFDKSKLDKNKLPVQIGSSIQIVKVNIK